MIRVYQRHGQQTTIIWSKIWNRLIIDCGAYWLMHDKTKNLYHEGSYDSAGYFISLRYVSREHFKKAMTRCILGLLRVDSSKSSCVENGLNLGAAEQAKGLSQMSSNVL